jgi:hypothetical protein
MMNLGSENGQFDDASDDNGDDDTPEMTCIPKITTPTSPCTGTNQTRKDKKFTSHF